MFLEDSIVGGGRFPVYPAESLHPHNIAFLLVGIIKGLGGYCYGEEGSTYLSSYLMVPGLQACTPRVVPLSFGILVRDSKGLHWPI